MDIKIYTTPTCAYCKMAKAYFKSQNWPYEELDVSENADNRQEMIKMTGQMGVPTIVINDKIIVGFNKNAIDQAMIEKIKK